MKEIALFILYYLITLFIYEVFVVRKAKKNKVVDKMPVEVKFLVSRYGLDMEKVNYNQLLQIIALVSSFDIALVVSAITLIENFIISIVVAVILVVLTIFISYHFVGNFYKKKGMIKNV